MNRNKVTVNNAEMQEALVAQTKTVLADMVSDASPYIPEGYVLLDEKRWTIQRKSDGSVFTWIDLTKVPANGTLDGTNYDCTIGVRPYGPDPMFDNFYRVNITPEFLELAKSIAHYGGVYVSKFPLRYHLVDERVTSKPNQWPTEIESVEEAETMVRKFSKGDDSMKALLMPEGIYDAILESSIASGEVTREEIEKQSELFGVFNSNPVVATSGKTVRQIVVENYKAEVFSLSGVSYLSGLYPELTSMGVLKIGRTQNPIMRGGDFRSANNVGIGIRWTAEEPMMCRAICFMQQK